MKTFGDVVEQLVSEGKVPPNSAPVERIMAEQFGGDWRDRSVGEMVLPELYDTLAVMRARAAQLEAAVREEEHDG